MYDARTIHVVDNSLRIQHRRSDHAARHRLKAWRKPRVLQAIARARRYAATDFSVLITGESGTGKELCTDHAQREPEGASPVRRHQLCRVP